MRILAPLVIASTASIAGAVYSPTCAPFNDPRQYYFGSNGQVLSVAQVETGRHDVPAVSSEYFRRLVNGLKARGMEIVVVPVPRQGFTLAGTLDKEQVKGTMFAPANEADYMQRALAAYQSTIDNLNAHGVRSVNFMQAAVTDLKTNPGKQLFFFQDGHWRPEGAQVAAKAVAAYIKTQLPSVDKELHGQQYKLVKGPDAQRKTFGWDVIVKQQCPETTWAGKTEMYPTWKADLISGGDLLADDDYPVFLAGTSYSAEGYKIGFAEFLKAELGKDITNLALQSGELMSSLLDFYTFKKQDDVDPRLLIWEMPTQYTDFAKSSSMNPVVLRQLLPLVAQKTKLVEEVHLKDVGLERVAAFNSKNLTGKKYFLKVTFPKYLSRELKITLTSEHPEELTLLKARGKATNLYTIELADTTPLRSLTLHLPPEVKGSATIQVYTYAD